MDKVVIVREDEPELVDLIRELLEDAGYTVVPVLTVEELLREAVKRSPCVALIDGMNPIGFDLWWLGPVLSRLNVPGVVFTAHVSAVQEFERDPHEYIGIISKPFDADRFLDVVNSICWEEHQAAAS